MAKRTETRERLTPQEIALLEKLVARGALVAVPQKGLAKPRQAVAATLSDNGRRILLYLSAKTIDLADEA
jgi:hypothetical protein